MYKILERRSYGLCAGIFFAIVVFGKMFGGSLKGLVPLAFCITSGVWFWTSDVIRSGRDTEWSSEKNRGQMVRQISANFLAYIWWLTLLRRLRTFYPNQ